MPVSLPSNTLYWVYWVGIGNEAIIKYDTYTEFYTPGKKGDEIYPTYAYGKGLLNSLPTVNTKDMIDYKFADNANSR